MKKFLILVCLFISILGVVFLYKPDKSATFVFGTSADYPPFSFFKDGSTTGFEIELAKKISDALNLQATFQDMSFDGLIAALQTGRIQGAISSITPTKERQERVLFSNPYMTSSTVLVHKETIESLKNIEEKTLGAQLGSTNEIQVQEWKKIMPSLVLKSLEKVPNLVQELKVGRVFAIVLGEPEARAIVQEHPDLKLWIVPGTSSDYAFALPKKSTHLLEKINGLLEAWSKDGTLDSLKKKWNLG